MDTKNKQVVMAVVILALASAMAFHLLRHGRADAAQPPAQAPASAAAADPDAVQFLPGAAQLAMIRTQVLPAVAMPAGDSLNARVAYDEDATVRMGVSVAGRVVAIKAAPGDQVRAGQVLAEIDSPDFGAALADLAKARADEALKRQAVGRARELVPGEGIAGKELDAAQAEYAQARAETARANQRVRNISAGGERVQGQTFRLVSPIAGVVVERSITPSLEITPGMDAPLFVLTNPKRLWLHIDVPEQMLAAVRLGGAVDVESDAYPGEHFKATIMQRGQAVDPNTRRVVVRARMENPEGKLLPEMFVRGTLLQPQGTAVKVPNAALVNRGLYTYVFVQTAPGRFQRRPVKMLTHGGDASYVDGGVAGGENIVTTGALLLDAEISARAGGAS